MYHPNGVTQSYSTYRPVALNLAFHHQASIELKKPYTHSQLPLRNFDVILHPVYHLKFYLDTSHLIYLMNTKKQNSRHNNTLKQY